MLSLLNKKSIKLINQHFSDNMANYTPVAETVESTEETDVKQEFMGSTEQPGKFS